ncbi:MAG TPA: cation-transporting P-type ATPase [Pseudonocardiaceae bacterium]|nr:cation-transporting P-type ATPase [Pseudonocardiaceae bacterium]
MAVTGSPGWHTQSADHVLRAETVDPARGLTQDEVARRLRQFGPNALAADRAQRRWRAFARQYADPMQIVLLVAGVGSIYPLGELGSGLLLIFLTLFNTVLGLRQEGKAAAAAAALRNMMIVTARVRRDGQLVEVPADQLVPGDVVSVDAGDIVPADGRLLREATLEVAEATLTGESLPVAKSTELVAAPDTPLSDRTDMVYMNSHVTRGAGEFVVTATGPATEIGGISGLLAAERADTAPLTGRIDRLTRQILLVTGVALLLSVAISVARGDMFTAVFTAAVAFAVGALPEDLPAVVTTILAHGAQELARAGAIVKQLRSVETLGSTSAINADKTGTLTLNEMTAVQLAIVGRRYVVDGRGYAADGRITHVAGQPAVALDQFLLPMALASDAVVTNGRLVGDPTEGALVVLAAKGGVDSVATRAACPRLAVLPFDAAYQLMATCHRMHDESGTDVVRCFVKGAPDQLLARAATVFDADDGPLPADDECRQRYLAEHHRLAAQGLRVLATARQDFDPVTFDPDEDLLPLLTGLELLALVGMVDPPRPGAADAVAAATAAGITVRMVTGDHVATAAAIARQLGIAGDAITARQFRAMSHGEARERIDDIGVIAGVTPELKVQLVELLQHKGHTVAMTGDGVNDAPAVRQADIGISMGATGTDVTREASVMVLTDDNFGTIVKAVDLGRGLYDNLIKYVRFQMGALFGFVFTFLAASVLDVAGGVPFLPIQTLWINFTVMLFQGIGLGHGAPALGLMAQAPRPTAEPIMTRGRTVWLVAVGLVMAAGTLGVIAWAEHAGPRPVAHTMGVVTFSLCCLSFSIAARDDRRTQFTLDTVADRWLAVATGASVLTLVLATVLGPLQEFLETTQLDLRQWLVCAGVALSITVAAEIRVAVLR